MQSYRYLVVATSIDRPHLALFAGLRDAGVAVRILFDLGSSHIRPAEKPVIAQAVKTAKDRQVSAICLIGHTDKLGDKAYNEKLSRARAQAVAAEMVHAGYPGKNITIVADPEAFGNMSLGKENASEIDRKVTIFYAR